MDPKVFNYWRLDRLGGTRDVWGSAEFLRSAPEYSF
ncbi:hypothetical protein PC119_g19725 [Phytophthora cactorum]|nr:hypothetical protein PC119_g19725 [Phytophthora cactorum]